MANNKVVLSNGTTIIDLSQDTVTSASHILRGHTGHLADGSQVSGAADYSVTYSMSGGAYATSTPVRVISGEGFTSRIKVPNGYILQNITVTMGGVDITNSAVEYEEIVKDLVTHTITYNLSNGISSNISPSEILDNEGLFLKLSASSGYNLSGVSVTMGGVDITSQVFEYDEDSDGGGGESVLIEKTITANGTYLAEDDNADGYSSVTVNVSGGGSSPTLQSKTVSYTPSETAQSATVTSDSGYDGLSSVAVSVGAISSTYVGSGVTRQTSKTVTPTETTQTAVASGVYTTGAVTVGAISSTYVGSGINQNDSTDLTASGATVTVPAGYYASQATKSVASGSAGTPTATKGTVSNHSISVTPSVTNITGYISGGTKTGTAVTVSASELVSGSETKTANGTYDVTNLASVVVNVPLGGLSEMVDVNSYDNAWGYLLMCLKKGDTVGGKVTYTSAFSNTETKILETGLTTLHGIMFSRYDVNIGTNVDGQPNKTIFIFLNSAGTLNAVGMYANGVARIYGQAQGTVQQGVPLNGAVRFSGGDVYYTGRYNKNANYQMLKTNTEYEWLAW